MEKYIDINATVQIIGTLINTPSLMNQTDKYWFIDDDFPNEFHQIVFGTIYRLFGGGTKNITLEAVEDYLQARPRSEAIFQQNNGEEFFLKAKDNAQVDAFNFYYNRLKKMTLLRGYDKIGMDMSFIYDPNNIMDIAKKERQENWLDNHTLEEIADEIDNKILSIRQKYTSEDFSETNQAGSDIFNLIEKFKATPEVGIPMYGNLINTVTRGARLKKFYLRSAPSGYGKSRTNIADACFFACDHIYDPQFGWIKNGTKNPTLFISTELELEEVQTMMLAFLSNVNEEHILNGRYEEGEEERIARAAEIISDSPLYITTLPDFSIRDIENTIRSEIREHKVQYVVHDYIHTSMKILEEITKRSGGVKLREDNILFMLSTKLKDLCNLYGIFLLSSTQLSADWKDCNTPDQNLLRGSKAIADKIDYGAITLPVTKDDLKALEGVLDNFAERPNQKISVYKNRRGKYKGIYLWCYSDLGTCRVNPIFATDWSYDMIKINNVKIEVKE